MDKAVFQMEEEMNVLAEATAAIHYFSTKRMEHMVIESCEADLAIIINAVAYYGEAMERYMEDHMWQIPYRESVDQSKKCAEVSGRTDRIHKS